MNVRRSPDPPQGDASPIEPNFDGDAAEPAHNFEAVFVGDIIANKDWPARCERRAAHELIDRGALENPAGLSS